MTRRPTLSAEDLSPAERWRLENPHKATFQNNSNGYDPARHTTCPRCGYEWEYDGKARDPDCPQCRGRRVISFAEDGRGLTQAQCNAIREAALDGLSYRGIAAVFTFVKYSAAHKHATGQCKHDHEVPPKS